VPSEAVLGERTGSMRAVLELARSRTRHGLPVEAQCLEFGTGGQRGCSRNRGLREAGADAASAMALKKCFFIWDPCMNA
jgi:hypothetical protein